MSPQRNQHPDFGSWVVEADTVELAERVVAEAHEAGASGLEELDSPRALRVFAPWGRIDDVRAALGALAGESALAQGPTLPVEAVDWGLAWRRGMEPVVVNDDLCIRPPFREAPTGFSGRSVVIEPGQAFGTGGHASTRLALELVCRRLVPGVHVLDVGCGSGVLALAALALGADRAWGLDCDPLAPLAARENASRNGLGARMLAVTATLDAVRDDLRFGLVVANMIRTELEPVYAGLAGRVAAGGVLVVSGLLAAEQTPVAEAIAARGLTLLESRERPDPAGDQWAALALGRLA